MNLLALALGLFFERFITHLFHLREPRWLDDYFDWGLRRIGDRRGLLGALIALIVVLIPVAPVGAVAFAFRDVLLGGPFLAFAVVVLLFSLGPRDLEDEVDEYVEAVESGDTERAGRVAKELLETEPPHEPARRILAIEGAIFVQANNRLFGVVLWFMLLGPTGAWLFRVTDLLRRRAMFEAGRASVAGRPTRGYLPQTQRVHGVMAWLPARALALGYALAGSFETAVSDWRSYYQDCSEHFFEVNDDVVACAGMGALGMPAEPEHTVQEAGARRALELVSRTLWVWLTAIAVLTIVGLAV